MTFPVWALCITITWQRKLKKGMGKEYVSYILISVTGCSVTMMCWNTTALMHENNTQQIA
jgi:hypothetical protein